MADTTGVGVGMGIFEIFAVLFRGNVVMMNKKKNGKEKGTNP